MIYALLSGVMFALCLVAATFFFRSFCRKLDLLFVLFATAFFILGTSQLALGFLNKPEADLPFAYLPRLVASLLIVVGIATKNRTSRKSDAKLRLIYGISPERGRRALR